ncbi:hypothetical protein D3C72_2246030 [compost metagenome]
MGVGAHIEPGFDGGRAAKGAIDALAGLGGQHHVATGRQIGRPLQVVAAGEAPGGVNEHRFEGTGMGIGQANLGAPILIKRG